MQAIIERTKQAEILAVTSQNLYWNENGIELTDPDGFGIILTINLLK
ncbi:hypothetical protein [Psychrobacter sp. KH172YL61]